ncbi:alpha/beta hydrolase [Paenibacillus sp. FSL H8-0537]|uniref:alpha/beta fold hydrolase n=1 Tax=Paenibacillus sp. FSL H8-0537 TaxID=2921399 RepID=UPI003100E164
MRRKFILLCATLVFLTTMTGNVFAKPDKEGLPDTLTGYKVDVGGFKLYGEVNGTKGKYPTVVFDAGYGDSYTIWDKVEPTVRKQTQTVLYDRAGIGWSQQSMGSTHTALDQSIQLHKLLKGLNVPPPYLFVTHGISGLNVRMYAALYQDEVSGVVFLDPSYEFQEQTLFPDEMDELVRRYKTEMVEEGDWIDLNITYGQVARTSRPLDPLRDLPIYVVTAGKKAFDTETMKIWNNMQKDIASLSDIAVRVVDKKSGHYVMTDNPDTVIKAVDNVLTQIQALP